MNHEFLDLFSSSEVLHLIRQGSYHAPLHMTCNTEEGSDIKPFRFLNFWCTHKQFKKFVTHNWCVDFVGNPFVEYQAKTKKLKKHCSLEQKYLRRCFSTNHHNRRYNKGEGISIEGASF